MSVTKRKEPMRLKVKGKDVNSRDLVRIGQEARCETEDFINQHIHDQGKGWPVSLRLDADSNGARPAQQVRRRWNKRARA